MRIIGYLNNAREPCGRSITRRTAIHESARCSTTPDTCRRLHRDHRWLHQNGNLLQHLIAANRAMSQ